MIYIYIYIDTKGHLCGQSGHQGSCTAVEVQWGLACRTHLGVWWFQKRYPCGQSDYQDSPPSPGGWIGRYGGPICWAPRGSNRISWRPIGPPGFIFVCPLFSTYGSIHIANTNDYAHVDFFVLVFTMEIHINMVSRWFLQAFLNTSGFHTRSTFLWLSIPAPPEDRKS